MKIVYALGLAEPFGVTPKNGFTLLEDSGILKLVAGIDLPSSLAHPGFHAVGASLIFLDEPTRSLDRRRQSALYELFRALLRDEGKSLLAGGA